MTTPRTLRSALVAAALSVPLLASCAADRDGAEGASAPTGLTTPEPTTTTLDPERAAIDARSYYENYEASTSDVAMASPPAAAALAERSVSALATESTMPHLPPYPPVPIEPGPLDDNTFVDPGASSWRSPDQQARSTFALDVDTGSFSVARRFVAEGSRPDPASIRIEEWINAVDPGGPPAVDGALAIDATAAASPYAPGVELVRVAVASRELDAADRPPANITFVVDTSGSMDIRARLGLVQSSLALLARTLRDDDTVAIVTYGTEASPVLEPTPASQTATIVSAIERLRAGGSTNMEAGLRLGYQQAREGFRQDGVNVVVLASDGVANVGRSDPDGLVELIRDSGAEGISLVTVGYGMGNFNDDLMEQLADQGDGFYAYVDTFEEAERLFVDQLTPTLTVVAREAKAQVEFDPEVVAEYRLVGYENRTLDAGQFRDDTVDAGEVGGGHHAVALYEIRRTADGVGRSPGTATLRWLPVGGDIAEERTAVLPSDPGPAKDRLRLDALVAATAEWLRSDPAALERGLDLDRLVADGEALVAAGTDGATEIAELLRGLRQLG